MMQHLCWPHAAVASVCGGELLAEFELLEKLHNDPEEGCANIHGVRAPHCSAPFNYSTLVNSKQLLKPSLWKCKKSRNKILTTKWKKPPLLSETTLKPLSLIGSWLSPPDVWCCRFSWYGSAVNFELFTQAAVLSGRKTCRQSACCSRWQRDAHWDSAVEAFM